MAEALLGLPDRRWLSAALVLNFNHAAYIHQSWLDVVPHGALVTRLRWDQRASPYVSRYLAETLGLVDSYVYDFTDPRSRLALIDGPALERLSLYVGIALRSTEIKREIDGERLRELKSALGEDGYRFASQRASFLGSIPEFPFEPSKRDPHLRMSLIGARYCVQQLSSLGRTLRRRTTLKLPSSWSSSLVDAPILGATREPALPPLLRKLIKEMLPQWHPLFV